MHALCLCVCLVWCLKAGVCLCVYFLFDCLLFDVVFESFCLCVLNISLHLSFVLFFCF